MRQNNVLLLLQLHGTNRLNRINIVSEENGVRRVFLNWLLRNCSNKINLKDCTFWVKSTDDKLMFVLKFLFSPRKQSLICRTNCLLLIVILFRQKAKMAFHVKLPL